MVPYANSMVTCILFKIMDIHGSRWLHLQLYMVAMMPRSIEDPHNLHSDMCN